MRKLLLAAFLTLGAASAWAQGQYPAGRFRSMQSDGAAALMGGGTLSGTWAGNPTFSGAATFSASVTHSATSALNGATTIGTNTAAAAAILNGPVGSARAFQWNTAGSQRWKWQANTTAEGGGNAGSDLDLFAFSDAGASIGNVMRITRSTGAVTINPNQTFNGTQTLKVFGAFQEQNDAIQGPLNLAISSGVPINPGSTSKPALYWDTNWTGTWDSGGAAPFFFRMKDAINAEPAAFIPTMWNFDEEYNTGAGNGRTTMVLAVNKNANSVVSNADNTFVNLTVKGNILANEGVPGTYRGNYQALNLNITCQADWLRACHEAEIDHGLYAGMHARSLFSFVFVNHQFDAAHATYEDAFLGFLSSPSIVNGTGGRTNIIQLGGILNQWPMDPTLSNSAILTIRPYGFNTPGLGNQGQPVSPLQYYAGFGFDLFYLNATTAVWRSPGFSVDGGGQHSMGPTTLTYDASGNATLAVTRVRETSAVVGTAGDHYKVTDEIADTNGGLWTVATLAATGLATVTQLQPGYATSCPGAGNAVTGGSGQSGMLTITCASLGNLILGASTHNVQIGGGSALATNATTGFPLVPTMAGSPSGTVGAAGKAALVVDTTNKKICYSVGGGTWECSAAFTP